MAIGRKNWLFAGSGFGGERAAVWFSLIGSARLHEVEPWVYLRDVLTRLPELGEEPESGLFREEEMSRRDAEADEIDVAQRVIDRFAAEVRAPTYARIDLLRSAAGAPLILELELIEPSLFLDHHPEAADRLVELLRAADG